MSAERLATQLQGLNGQFDIAENAIEIATANTPAQLCVANPNRWGLVIAAAWTPTGTTSGFGISTNPGVTSPGGIFVPQTWGPIFVNVRQWGDAPRRAWYGISANAPMYISVIEILMVS